MLTIKRLVIISGATIAGTLWGIAPALADNVYGNVNCNQTPSPACSLTAGRNPDHSSVSGNHDTANVSGNADNSGYDGIGCRNVPVDYKAPGGQPPEPGGWFMVLCSPDGKDPDSHGPVWIPAGANNVSTVSPAVLAQVARKQIRLPAPQISANPTGDQLVSLPTWMWVSSGWAPISATASVPGVSVTAVATPTSVSWSMGDGTMVTCTGPGTPFRADVDPKSASPDCGHTYRTSSARQAGQAYPVTATIHWTVSWSGAGQGGTFPEMTTTSNAAFRVAESQALNN
ncbi:hypothetical protein ACIA8G_21680 [Lentzea sp. NPDC051213]|uniref:hypothetical protein n=1 Tax=Lentzea sp. NPDC051213 TaxID=3364126 RepID=UPI0037951ED9